ncbi:VanZ family protein [Paenibacillus hunanensis]|uniref:VanZ family protein n=1 Tax=Paenibacillus hunanensis TaxID=539262 RepID=UPI0020274CB1|nr:VanZ family protein [Paenibacillus hunanensis]MCL9659912.1 VanZ family protein [Paenibacillus hunanensis]
MRQKRKRIETRQWVSVWQYVAAGVLLAYTALLLYWMFWGFGRSAPNADTPYRYNIIPLHTIVEFATMRVGSRLDQWINLLGNIAVFVPFGVLVPMVLRVRFWMFTCGFAGWILLLELMQLATRRGTFDVDDILLNTLGACGGYALFMLMIRWRRAK